jgi:Tfp pilus assembly protein PilW
MIKNKRKGFTLIEFLVAFLICIIAMFMALQLSVSFNKDYRVLMSYLGSYLKGREMIDIISKDCREAVRIMDDYGGYVTTTNRLVLKVPSIDASGDIMDVDNEFDYIIYRIQNQDLWKTVIPGTGSSRPARNSALKQSIDSLYMACVGTPLSSIPNKSSCKDITIWVSVAETILGKTYTVNPGTTVKLMNYEWEFVR